MSVLRRAFEVRSSPLAIPDQADYGTYSPDGWWGAGMAWQGSQLSPNTSSHAATSQAMRLSAVFACLRLLSEAVATLPLDTYFRQGGIRRPFRPRPAYLSFDPPQASRINYMSQVMLSLLTDGNAYILTPRDRLGEPVDLIPLDPTMVQVTRNRGVVKYVVVNQELDPTVDLMHIMGMMLPGAVRGISPIGYARETIGLGLAAQRFGAGLFENGALPSAVIEAPERMSDEAVKRWRETWNAGHAGIQNAQKIGVLTGGAKLTKVSINPEDAQFLQTRQFQVPDVARVFGVPPHLIADASNSTSWGSGLAEQNLAFAQFSLRPWLERIEEAHSRLMTTHGLPRAFVKLNLDAMLRADLKERYDSYSVGITDHFLTINEARALEDLEPVPWGDEPFVLEKITETGPAPSGATTPPPAGEPPADSQPPSGGDQ